MKRSAAVKVLLTIATLTIGAFVATLLPPTKLEHTVEIDEAGPVLFKLLSDDIAASFVPPVPEGGRGGVK